MWNPLVLEFPAEPRKPEQPGETIAYFLPERHGNLRSSGAHHKLDGAHQAIEFASLLVELFVAFRREPVETRLAMVFGNAPFGREPALDQQPSSIWRPSREASLMRFVICKAVANRTASWPTHLKMGRS